MKVPWELLLVMVLLTSVAVAAQELAPKPAAATTPLASDSTAPDGARAVYVWLQSLGYEAERLERNRFLIDETTDVLLILAPSSSPKKDHLSALHGWVEQGGILIMAGSGAIAIQGMPLGGSTTKGDSLPTFLAEFGLKLQTLGAKKEESAPSQPLLLHPVVNRARVDATSFITGSAKLVSYLGEAERPVAAGLAVGKGRVYVLASNYAFSNQGIGQAGNAALLLNWLPRPEESVMVGFDEAHHDLGETRSLLYNLFHEPWGWASIYAVGAIFLYLLLGGRHFGRSVPVIVDTRRVAAEYVVSLANLLRRGNKTAWVARHYEQALRRKLAVAAGLDPSLGTAAVASRLAEMGRVAGKVEGREASRALLSLQNGAMRGTDEGRLVRLAADAHRIIKACGGRGPC